ncbi:MAG: adenosylmethionine decarboxylase [Oceanospirillaceae bacterium]|jgi:S-adenosylmethionine decarboxylase|uniref:adenosylmethionine decarboxylase n=1 Tax=Marinobacterium litorale TaxID=404770 RepID=UPI00040C1CBB|nr:adenosylmethionine decarboxylase [Marinobacterium litorale]MBS98563.1 adenosylmethionine decarboxylase [Oceanospirillaceae bacterium]
MSESKSDTLSAVSARGDWPAYGDPSQARKDYFVQRDGYRFAGTHLIIDLYGAADLDDIDRMELALREAVEAAGATLLHLHLHHFTPNGGISGVAVLAESHISVHTWPERDYAAFDVFMCGAANPDMTVPVLEDRFQPREVHVQELLRGKVAIDEDTLVR